MIIEIFKPIKGYEGKYEISNLGNVKSLLNRYKNTKGICILKPKISNKGYYRVQLSNPKATLSVHRLVAEAFVSNPHNYPVVNHLDNNPRNNNALNLEWTTLSGNLLHAQKQGRLFKAQSKGGKVTSAKTIANSLREADLLVGKTINNWYIIENLGFIKYDNYSRISFKCKCTCGAIANVQMPVLQEGKSTFCNNCKYTYLQEKQYIKVSTKLKDTSIGIWRFTGNSNFYPDKPIMKLVKFEAICTECSTKVMHPYPTIISTAKPLKKCPYCNKR